MVNCYLRKSMLAIAAWFAIGGISPAVAAQFDVAKSDSGEVNLAKDTLEAETWLAKSFARCKEIDSTYQEVFGFETEDYYINVCQRDDDFYYHRQSKTDMSDAFLVSAQSAYGGDVFQATYGKAIYFVGKDGGRFYSSVMQNSSEIVFEPELEQPVLANEAVEGRSTNSSVTVSRSTVNSSGIEDKSSDLRAETIEPRAKQPLVCTDRSSNPEPELSVWQQLIGKSTATVNQYAISNGHDFFYSNASENAQIQTRDGKVISLNIANASETIEEVCIRPVAQR